MFPHTTTRVPGPEGTPEGEYLVSPSQITGLKLISPRLGLSVCTYLHSSWLRATTTTEEPPEEAKSLDESEEKHKRVAPHSSFGILDTYRKKGGRGEGGGERAERRQEEERREEERRRRGEREGREEKRREEGSVTHKSGTFVLVPAEPQKCSYLSDGGAVVL